MDYPSAKGLLRSLSVNVLALVELLHEIRYLCVFAVLFLAVVAGSSLYRSMVTIDMMGSYGRVKVEEKCLDDLIHGKQKSSFCKDPVRP